MSAAISPEDFQRMSALIERKRRITEAITVYRSGGDISAVLDPEDFSMVQQVASTAVQNKLGELKREAEAALP